MSLSKHLPISDYKKFDTQKRKVLIESLEQPFFKAKIAIYDNFFYCTFFPEHWIIEIPVLKQNLKQYKDFFKELKKECTVTEFIFVLNEVKLKIENHIENVLDNAFKDEYYTEYTFDYGDVVLFIERYIAFCKIYISDILYQYSFDMQKELFYGKYDIDNRLNISQSHLEKIAFNEKYNKESSGFIFGGSDFGIIYKIRQLDVKHFFEAEINKEDYKIAKQNALQTNNEILNLNDLSNSKLTEKIIALNEIGVLDFLIEKEPFNMSINRLAEFLSLCIGEKATSIQSYINPILNNSEQTKSPYNTIKTVEKTKQKLIELGCKLKGL
ncbi:hypothetical protein [Polaribacter sp. IC063]|uniref:hypothetical protein n=1 Tax=Polaribacter sp. IC063 TaxID=57031 RepID=UPI0011BF06D2|nr:hypothetical protein [Polaribacter sp. IC063]TXD50257.1 hypothetical protein ES043_16770 [Polaribacter sp. IC063]